MANSKYQSLVALSDEDLMGELEQTESQYIRMRFDNAVTGLENPQDLRGVRRDIARIKTEIRRREIAQLSTEDIASRSKIRARRRK